MSQPATMMWLRFRVSFNANDHCRTFSIAVCPVCLRQHFSRRLFPLLRNCCIGGRRCRRTAFLKRSLASVCMMAFAAITRLSRHSRTTHGFTLQRRAYCPINFLEMQVLCAKPTVKARKFIPLGDIVLLSWNNKRLAVSHQIPNQNGWTIP